jgi:hypothetical protein
MKIQYLRTIFLGELYEFLFRFLGLRGRQPHKPTSPKKRGDEGEVWEEEI